MPHLAIKFALPKPAAPVAQRELSVAVNAEDPRLYPLPGGALESDEFVFRGTDSYRVTLVDIDKHGNRSLPSVPLSGAIADDIRPAQPAPPKAVAECSKRLLSDEEAKKELEAKAAKEGADKTKEPVRPK